MEDGTINWHSNNATMPINGLRVSVGEEWLRKATELEKGAPRGIIWDYCQE